MSSTEGQTLTQRFEPSFYITHPDFERVVQWYRCTSLICVWEPIPGATEASYVLTSGDVGMNIRVSVQLKSYSILSPGYAAAGGPVAALDDEGPEVSIIPAAADAVASTGWYNRVTSGGDGVEVEVVAADPSGVSSLVCHDGNDAVLDVDGASGSIVLGDGRHAVECVATDNRSNTAIANAQFDVDQTAPVVTVPAPMTVSATSTAGAAVTYVSGATDNLDPSPTVLCSPASGGVFPVATTTVTCEATDEAGNSAAKQFTVEVLGAADQLDLLLIDATGVGTGTSLADKVKEVQTAVDAGRTRNACTGLVQFLDMVTKQAAKGKLTSARAASLTTQANTIKATLSC